MAKILLVDDLPVVLEVIARLLEKLGHEVWRARDAREALGLLHGPGQFDLAIIDVLLKGTSGIDLAKQIRSELASFPMVAMSAHVDLVSANAMGSLRKLGIDHIVEKPVNVGDLDAAVKSVLRKNNV
jgi:CheY-like chemotaxis protein